MRQSLLTMTFMGVFLALTALPALADEGGVSFWLPGQMGSLAAAPAAPGWSLPMIYYHADTDADASREFDIGGRLAAGLDAGLDLLLVAPTYTLKKPVAGGQATISFAAVLQDVRVSAGVTLTDPGGAVIDTDVSDSQTGTGDIFPQFSLRWNHGVHNVSWYALAGVPTGSYEVGRLANLSTNHWSLDSGAGYTFFNPTSGHEFSVTGGLTYSFENPDTDYQNGIDAHVDLAWSEFVTPQTHVGMVAYAFQQLSGDSGSGADLGDFEGRVFGIGPQVGHMFPMGGKQGYFNFRAYYEFGAENRLEGWNAWVTVSLPLGRAPASN